ncbi:uncharacterized protein LOC131613631 [Vicia villosa]|uniref:uncharacterized protein LOC131613631 n=1 Tax=Vicia villosa TaxID=3911 RepID=UPI00273AC64D|nr:uncharacterized protein LOC131613631 [Vicia villosa]
MAWYPEDTILFVFSCPLSHVSKMTCSLGKIVGETCFGNHIEEHLGQIPQANARNRNGDDDEFRALGRFQRNNPPTFEGEHEPDKAQAWLKVIEKIFRVMNCTDAQRVQFGAHMLEKEAEDWWGNTAQRFDEEGIQVTWDHFRDAFLENYFPEDCRGKKEVEFLELKQENDTVAEYAARFQDLIQVG